MIAYENRASYILYNIVRKLDPLKKIIIPANVCPIVIATLLKANKNIELVDISKDTYHMDTNKVINLLKYNPVEFDSILFVRTYGAELDFYNFFEQLKSIKKDFFIIDDKCLAPPEFEVDIKKNVDVTLFSTGYSKYVELGFGGYAFIKDNFPYVREDLIYSEKDHDLLTDDFRNVINDSKGFTYRDTNWLDAKTPEVSFKEYWITIQNKLIEVNEHKNKLNKIFQENLPKEYMMGVEFNNWRFNLLVDNKDKLLHSIFKNGLFASSHYSPITKFLNKKNMPIAEDVYSNVVNLFNDFRYNEEMAHRLVSIINEI